MHKKRYKIFCIGGGGDTFGDTLEVTHEEV